MDTFCILLRITGQALLVGLIVWWHIAVFLMVLEIHREVCRHKEDKDP